VDSDNVFLLIHILAAFWYVAGLTAVQISLVRAWQTQTLDVRVESFEEASHYQGILLVPGAIASVASGLFLWAQLDYDLITTPWLIALEALYIATLLVCLPLTGIGIRRARLAALQARKSGQPTSQQAQTMSDGGPLIAGGVATLLVPVMAALSVFRP
jgi:uncharacterized membrane protein